MDDLVKSMWGAKNCKNVNHGGKGVTGTAGNIGQAPNVYSAAAAAGRLFLRGRDGMRHARRQAAGRGRSDPEACVRACAPEGSLGSSQTKRARRRAGRGRTASSVYAAIPWTGMPGRRSGRRAPSAGPAASPALLGSCGRLGDLKAMPLARAVCARGVRGF